MPNQRGPVPLSGKEKDGRRDVTQEVLDLLNSKDSFVTSEAFPDVSQIEIKAALDRLASRSMIKFEASERDVIVLTNEAEDIVTNGSHEWKVWDAVTKHGKLPIKELPSVVGLESAKVGQGNAFKLKWVKKDGDSLVPIAKEVEDQTRLLLEHIQKFNSVEDSTGKLVADLRKRKLVKSSRAFDYTAQKGEKYAREMAVEVTDLTSDMLAGGAWESANFKSYNFKALGADQSPGTLHPLNKVRSEFRQIFFEQGFVEMPTDRFVDTGFWNFDALFVPQQHPARDMQDTFFIADPVKADPPRDDPRTEATMLQMEEGQRKLYNTAVERQTKPRNYKAYWDAIKAVHEGSEGKNSHTFGSRGYRYKWSADESLRLVLRTHTTAVSTWCLHRLAEDPRPARYFSIDRVFRNEAVDATHLAEFHQVEGVIADYGLTLGGLMKFLEEFFGRLGLTGLRFKPAYNPYTEPSMEIFGYHKGLGKWIEIGNSGMFRPEMLEPMGLPRGLRVYGFGLSLERPTMLKYGISNIRALLGHKVDLGFIHENGAVRLDKN